MLKTVEKRRNRVPKVSDLRVRQAQAVIKIMPQWNEDWDKAIQDLLKG